MSSKALAALRECLDQLAEADPADTDAVELAYELIELRAAIDRMEGAWLRRLGAFDARSVHASERVGEATGVPPTVSACVWLRNACRLTTAHGHERLRVARTLRSLPATAAALRAGQMSYPHAVVVTKTMRDLTGPLTEVAGQLAEQDAPAHPDGDGDGAGLAADPVAGAEAILVEAAAGMDPSLLRQVAAVLRHRVDPNGDLDAAEKAYERRELFLSPGLDGLYHLNGVLDPEGGAALATAVNSLCGPRPGDTRSPAQQRADALTEIARRVLDDGTLPITAGERPHLNILVPLQALLEAGYTGFVDQVAGTGTLQRLGAGISATGAARGQPETEQARPRENRVRENRVGGDSVGRNGVGRNGVGRNGASTDAPERSRLARMLAAVPGSDPPELAFAGPVDRQTARRLACDAALARIVTDPKGLPINLGRRVRIVPGYLRRAVVARDRGCAHPGCDRPPEWCQIHHIVSWLDGGTTDLDNLILLCALHHHHVHDGRWQPQPVTRARTILDLAPSRARSRGRANAPTPAWRQSQCPRSSQPSPSRR
jgi:hypothetical protein